LIQALANAFHKLVEKAVDNSVGNLGESPFDVILHRIAQDLGNINM
jgi:hypothetical protein